MTEIPSITNIQDITGATNVAGKSNLGKEDFLNLLVVFSMLVFASSKDI